MTIDSVNSRLLSTLFTIYTASRFRRWTVIGMSTITIPNNLQFNYDRTEIQLLYSPKFLRTYCGVFQNSAALITYVSRSHNFVSRIVTNAVFCNSHKRNRSQCTRERELILMWRHYATAAVWIKRLLFLLYNYYSAARAIAANTSTNKIYNYCYYY